MTEGTTYYVSEDIRSNTRRDFVYAAKGDKVKLISFQIPVAIVEHEKTGRFSVNISKLLSDPKLLKEELAKLVKPEPRVTFKQFKEAMKPRQAEQNKLF